MVVRLLLVATVACWLAIIVGTHLPSEHVPSALSTRDKLLHTGAYAVLTTLVILVWRGWPRPPVSFSLVLVVGLMALHAALDEVTQQFAPGRAAEYSDWLADLVGILIGVVVGGSLARYLWPVPTKQSRVEREPQISPMAADKND